MEYKKGTYVIGTVTGIEDYGIFVKLDNEYSGLIHISEIAKTYIKNINKYVSIGDEIKVKIIETDDDSKHLKLSIKNFNYKNLKNNRVIIEETTTGFKPLEDKLDDWISKKITEIKKNKVKNDWKYYWQI